MKLNSKGFSLVELMVVVAIIGILASIAVPSVNKYMAKSRQSEAKTNLGSLYSAQKAFAAEYVRYHTAFQAIGFSPEGKLRYNVGFGGPGTNAGAAEGYVQPATVNAAWISSGTYCGAAGTMTRGCTVLTGADGNPAPALAGTHTTSVAATGPSFIGGASAVLVAGATDTWTINEVKDLQNTSNGIQ